MARAPDRVERDEAASQTWPMPRSRGDRWPCSRATEIDTVTVDTFEGEVSIMSARPTPSDLATEVWRDIAKRSFAVIAHVNDEGEPRSSGVVYALIDHSLFVAVAPDSWKARALQTGDQVSVTVPVPRGGLLAMLLPIPPATISFHARVTVHRAEAMTRSSLPKELRRLLPETEGSPICMLELTPEGRFLTYGIGVSLPAMRDPAIAAGHVPTG